MPGSSGNSQAAARNFLAGTRWREKETSGIEHASADLFRGSRYALVGVEAQADARSKAFAELIHTLGAETVWCDADTHDWAVEWFRTCRKGWR